ncbi:ankyrin repeat domain-containing protein [Lacipirellula limnantheis]|uniref:ankyrin repeat domain-containing protein n=1 Tax=Lacipirellula limnantheis TaxID=2528024 RepID=UPI0011A6271B|nr:ankyrin repeat domain-containing protein [Lacipirellula limnantheis]
MLKAALSATIGQSIQPALANDPVAFANAVSRFAKWSPELSDGYDPGWEYRNRLSDKQAAAVVTTIMTPALNAAQAKAAFLEDDEYVQLAKVVKDADAVARRHMDAVQRGGASKEEGEAYSKAMASKNEGATRIKEIEFELSPESRWHALAGWKSADYFDDPQILELCDAIERNDVPEMERLISAGANVNARGNDNMTPLLWALPDRKHERFRCLLNHGADPNVIISSDFGTAGRPFHPYPAGGALFYDRGCTPGQSVTHLAARSPDIEYLRAVLQHGGDPNLVVADNTKLTPLDIVIDRYYPDMKERVELLVAAGADLNRYCKYRGGTPAMLAVMEDRFSIAMQLLQAGADPTLYRPDGTEKLIHYVVRKERFLPNYRQELAGQYHALVGWLEEHGESVEQARADSRSWDEQYKKAMTSKDHARIRKQIIKDQKRRSRPMASQIAK